MGIKKIGVVGNANKGHVVESIARLSEWAKGKGLEVLPEKEAAGKLGTRGYHGDELGTLADLVVTMGGTARSCKRPGSCGNRTSPFSASTWGPSDI